MFPFYKQYDSSDCGPTCLKMIVKFFGKSISLQALRELCHIEREGVSINGIQHAAHTIGFKTLSIKATLKKEQNSAIIPTLQELPLPTILHWNNNHFVVLYKIKNNYAFIADPAHGKIKLHLDNLQKHFFESNEAYGKAILFEPQPYFFNKENPSFENQAIAKKFKFIGRHIPQAKKYFLFLIPIILLKLVLQAISPFLAQKTFDLGILQKNINVLSTILIVQISVFIIASILSYFESVFSNKISQKINFSFIREFIYKLFKVPLNLYNHKKASDFIHRVYDLKRIEAFLIFNFASILLSSLGLITLSVVMLFYSKTTFAIFLSYNALYAIWIIYSLRKRKELDYEKFDIEVNSHRYLTEMIEGMQEIRLNGNESKKMNALLKNQSRFFENDLKSIKAAQFLSIGGGLINNLGFGTVGFYTGYLAITNTITIGEMAAIQLLLAQLNSMFSTVLTSLTVTQEVKFSLERVLEIQSIKEEASGSRPLESAASIVFKNVDFSYTELSDKVIKNLNLKIEFNRTTAIVGTSGSGKSTLMKLALNLCKPTAGQILLNKVEINEYDTKEWRKKCGVVTQESYLFTDTILNNITASDDNIDFECFIKALKMSCLYEFVMSLPIKYDTVIGTGGLALSSGQRQRVLIARMIYKNPDYIFMDEATNSLDSETEKTIVNNLELLFANKTRLIIAHRLNTVKNAAKIIVLQEGVIVEEGSHEELIHKNGYYYELVKEQLQLT